MRGCQILHPADPDRVVHMAQFVNVMRLGCEGLREASIHFFELNNSMLRAN
jgi:hypothetical protein